MAHFAQLDQDSIVTQVIVISNSVLVDDTGKENEELGIAFCRSLYGGDTRWVQTSYNGNIRKQYAGIGFKYDATLDAFIGLQPYPSWVLNQKTKEWEAPVPMPNEELPQGSQYSWSESDLKWLVKTAIK